MYFSRQIVPSCYNILMKHQQIIINPMFKAFCLQLINNLICIIKLSKKENAQYKTTSSVSHNTSPLSLSITSHTTCSQTVKLKTNVMDTQPNGWYDSTKTQEERISVNPAFCEDKVLSGNCDYTEKNCNTCCDNLEKRRPTQQSYQGHFRTFAYK